jgi:hypothetical protein
MQSDANDARAQLKAAFTSIPSEVNVKKDVPLATDLIISTANTLGAGPPSRPAIHPRPVNAGLLWDELSEDAQQNYAAVLDLLESSASPNRPSDEQADEALQKVRNGLMYLATPMQQGYSGMVQRND